MDDNRGIGIEKKVWFIKMESQTISIKSMTKWKMQLNRLLYPETIYNRPKYRYECENSIRPCPFVGCKYNLYLDVNPNTGTIKVNFPNTEVCNMPESCVLDVAERKGISLVEIGNLMNITRERVRQIEESAMASIKDILLSICG